MTTDLPQTECDVVVIGAGPAGMQLALNIATEGRTVCVLEAEKIGGQIRATPHVENLLGHAYGITGAALADAMQRQTVRFGARIVPMRADALVKAGPMYVVQNTTGTITRTLVARAVVLATGVQYEQLNIAGLQDALTCKAAQYSPEYASVTEPYGKRIVVVGGGNAAGQAITTLAASAAHVDVVVRNALATSDYITKRIAKLDNVSLHRGAIARIENGCNDARSIVLDNGTSINADALLLCTRQLPTTQWLPREIERDAAGFILAPHYATTMQGVFAIGDVRADATRRLSSAIGSAGDVMPQLMKFLRNA